MKYLVVSDIHGSLSGARCVPECLAYHKADRILCLGDILYHGPRNDLPEDYAPKEVIQIMNPLADAIVAVRGNCDAEVDQMVLDFPLTADYNILFSKGQKIFMSHGHVYYPDHLPRLAKGDIFLSGHTHIPTAKKKDGIYLLNPGSTGIPKGGWPASYGLIADRCFTVYTLDHKELMHIDLK